MVCKYIIEENQIKNKENIRKKEVIKTMLAKKAILTIKTGELKPEKIEKAMEEMKKIKGITIVELRVEVEDYENTQKEAW